MTNAYCLSGLVEKRAELAGEAAALESRLADLRAGLTHLDATILLFDPGYQLAGIRPKRPPVAAGPFAHGELTRLIYGVLRETTRARTLAAITAGVMAAKGMDPADGALSRDVRERVGRTLRKKVGRVLRRVALDGGGVGWGVVP